MKHEHSIHGDTSVCTSPQYLVYLCCVNVNVQWLIRHGRRPLDELLVNVIEEPSNLAGPHAQIDDVLGKVQFGGKSRQWRVNWVTYSHDQTSCAIWLVVSHQVVPRIAKKKGIIECVSLQVVS